LLMPFYPARRVTSENRGVNFNSSKTMYLVFWVDLGLGLMGQLCKILLHKSPGIIISRSWRNSMTLSDGFGMLEKH
jgi:hypothetical protein